jgi:C1A family cysteine protease
MADMWLYDDFNRYTSLHGVYKHARGDPIGMHTLILLGWGTDDINYNPPRDYWLVMNSWGTKWGFDGYG